MPGDMSHNHEHNHSHSQSTSDPKEMELTSVKEHFDCSSSGDHSHEHEHSHSEDIGHHSHDNDHSSPNSDHHTNEESHVSKPKENINLRAAYIHVLGDLVQSIAVLIAGLVIMWKPEWQVIDPILSIIFCPIIFYVSSQEYTTCTIVECFILYCS